MGEDARAQEAALQLEDALMRGPLMYPLRNQSQRMDAQCFLRSRLAQTRRGVLPPVHDFGGDTR